MGLFGRTPEKPPKDLVSIGGGSPGLSLSILSIVPLDYIANVSSCVATYANRTATNILVITKESPWRYAASNSYI